MRILWVGNPPFAPSGYGEQAGLFVPRLKALGHDVAVLCNYGVQGIKLSLGGIDHYPSDGHWGNRSLATITAKHQADLILILHDAWVMKPALWPDGLPPAAIWTPIDHNPIPPVALAVLNDDKVRPIAMSRFGYHLMEQAHLDPAYVPHGVDTQLFKPQPELRNQVRDNLEIPRDAFLVGMVAANKSNPEVDRKSFAKSFQAFALFAQEHPDAYMYAHTEAQPIGCGVNLDILAGITGIPEGHLRFPPDDAWHIGLPREFVATIYQAFDVLLNPSMGEGFGIPILEAQACGVPVITSNHSAMPEITHAGWLVDGEPWWDELQKAFFYSPYIHSIKAALEDAYQARGDTELCQAAVAFAQRYDADAVTEKYWKPALDAVTAPRKPSQPPDGAGTRADRRRADRAARKKQKREVVRGEIPVN